MKSIIKSIVFVSAVIFMQGAVAQEVSNIKVLPTQSTIEISYDLLSNAPCTIELYYSDDKALTWKGPLQKVTGDVGYQQSAGNGKRIVWDAAGELGSIEGVLQFKVVATYAESQQPTLQSKLQQRIIDVEQKKMNAKLIALKKKRNIWIFPTLVAAGAGGYAYSQTGMLYEKYKNSTTDAATIRGQVQTMSIIYPVAFVAAGFSLVEFFIQSGKYSKEKKKKVVFSPFYLKHGAGINLTVKL